MEKYCSSCRYENRAQHSRSRVTLWLLESQVFFVTLVSKSLEVYDCSTLPNGMRVLDSSADIECFRSATHSKLMMASAATIGAYMVGIPLSTYCVLKWANQEMHNLAHTRRIMEKSARSWTRLVEVWLLLSLPKDEASLVLELYQPVVRIDAAHSTGDGERADEKPHHVFLSPDPTPSDGLARHWAAYVLLARARLRRVQHVAGTVRDRFRPSRWYWSLVMMARRSTIVAITVMQSNRPTMQLSLMTAVLLISYVMNQRYQPYKHVRSGGNDRSEEHAAILSVPVGCHDNSADCNIASFTCVDVKPAGSTACVKKEGRENRWRQKLAQPPQQSSEREGHRIQPRNEDRVRSTSIISIAKAFHDPNVLEAFALLLSFGVLVCAISFKATHDARLAGWAMPPTALTAVDYASAAFLCSGSVFMASMVMRPLCRERKHRVAKSSSFPGKRPRPAGSKHSKPDTVTLSVSPQR